MVGKPLLDMTVREWLDYHQRNVHLGAFSGHPELQQQWRGRTILKNPMDCWVYQEIIHDTKPEAVVEIGVALGGNLLYMADLLNLSNVSNPLLIGVDVSISGASDLLSIPYLKLISGRSDDHEVFRQVSSLCAGKRTMVIADGDHSAANVLTELKMYASLVSVGCYYIVEDGICDVMGWQPSPGPQVAAKDFMAGNQQFVDDSAIREKYLMTYNPNGYLRRVN